MISTIKKGIVIRKVPYKEKHEILHILLETGVVDSFFYENGARNKKNKINILDNTAITYVERKGLNKIIVIEVEKKYPSIMSNLETYMYLINILEIITIVNVINIVITYSEFEELLYDVDHNYIDVKLVNVYFMCKLLEVEGFKFKYKRVELKYTGYDFKRNIFTDETNEDKLYILPDKLIKLIHILTINDISILEKVTLSSNEYSQILNFLVRVMREYIGIETKTYEKIQEIGSIVYSFERKKNNE